MGFRPCPREARVHGHQPWASTVTSNRGGGSTPRSNAVLRTYNVPILAQTSSAVIVALSMYDMTKVYGDLGHVESRRGLAAAVQDDDNVTRARSDGPVVGQN
jgi:hypothetical protein